MSCPPILTNGEVTPKVVHEFENHCITYFVNAKDGVANSIKVSKILGCIENTLIDDWAAVDHEQPAALSFPKFMKEFCKQWLPFNWEETVQTEMMNSQLNPLQKFETWAAEVMAHNVSLWNTLSHLSDNQLQSQLAVAIDQELRTSVMGADVSEITDIHEWVTHMKKINDN
ncbi:hypothetical protein EI94DRAFT_1799256 [Lactarius quietus]|nr:hypothetical protein EI94DRAFT_1799256 [Lactarius quietus]